MTGNKRRAFGVLPDGRRVDAIELSDGCLTVTILTRGAVLNDVRLAGVAYPLTLGSPDLAPYLGGMAFYGAIVGPVANRIGGAAALIDGHRFEFRSAGQPNLLHGGEDGLHGQLWTVEDLAADSVTLRLDLADGQGGFPGNRVLRATYSLPEPGTLALTLEGSSDAPTLLNLAHHGYWNLDGTDTYDGHHLQISADHYLPTTAQTLPTGEVRMVNGSAFDFRQPKSLHPGTMPRIDHNFCIAQDRGPLRTVLSLTGQSGVTLQIDSTEPGLQVFDGGNDIAAGYTGHEGQRLGPFAGLALEPQGWPDAPNNSEFPSILHGPDRPYHQETHFRFSRAPA